MPHGAANDIAADKRVPGVSSDSSMSFVYEEKVHPFKIRRHGLGLWLEHSDVTDVSSHDSETPTLVASVK